jgi:hypothetical protein
MTIRSVVEVEKYGEFDGMIVVS